MIDYTKLLKKMIPTTDGEDVLRTRVGVVTAIGSGGLASVTVSGVSIPNVPVLAGAGLVVNDVVQILSYRGSLFILGPPATTLGAATPVFTTTTTGDVGTVATGFSVNDVRVATSLGGKLVDLDLYINRTGADIVATTGNITDTLMFTLTAFLPSHAKSAVWGNGTTSGEAIVNTTGSISLRTSSSNLVSGTNVRLSTSYLLD